MTGSTELKFRIIVSLLMPTFDNNYAFFSKKQKCLLQKNKKEKRKQCKGDVRGSNTSLGLLALRFRIQKKCAQVSESVVLLTGYPHRRSHDLVSVILAVAILLVNFPFISPHLRHIFIKVA
jgi:hypothetical protein